MAKIKDAYTVQGNQLVLSKDWMKATKFKKITGTRAGAILGENKYSSPFQVWAEMTGLVPVNHEDNEATAAGKIIEPKLRDYAAGLAGKNYITVDPKSVNYDEFADNKIFGGLIDAHPANKKGEIDYSDGFPMLEIKTTSMDKLVYGEGDNGKLKMEMDTKGMPLVKTPGGKKAEWYNKETGEYTNVPAHYKHQLALYMALRGQSKGGFVVGFLKPEDYVNPQGFKPNKENTQMIEMNIDLDKYQKEVIPYLKQWHKTHIAGGVSPEATKEDIEWFNKNRIKTDTNEEAMDEAGI